MDFIHCSSIEYSVEIAFAAIKTSLLFGLVYLVINSKYQRENTGRKAFPFLSNLYFKESVQLTELSKLGRGERGGGGGRICWVLTSDFRPLNN